MARLFVLLAPVLAFQPALLRAAPAAPVRAAPVQVAEGPTFDERFAQAGNDAAALWELHLWCRTNQKYSESRTALKKIVEIDPEHKEARAALGHVQYEGQWFDSTYKLSEYKRVEEQRMLTEKGLVRLNDQWVPVADAPFMRMGWTKSDAGEWVNPRELARREDAKKHAAEGWKQQIDLVWVAPDEAANWEKELVKCGSSWLNLEEANAYHAKVGQEWHYPGQHFLVYSTLDFDGTKWAAWWSDNTYADLARVYGVEPKSKPIVTVLNGIAQYNGLASGDPAAQRPPTEGNGYSSCHFAYVGEQWIDTTGMSPTNPPEYIGGGICYWDQKDPNLAPFGEFSVRHAAGLSYAEAIDPSWTAVSTYLAALGAQAQISGFWTEKKIPRWLRFGAASYVERFYKDAQPAEGRDPWWARNWALENIRSKGGPRPLAQILALNLDPNDQTGSSKLICEAGMVVSFILDGKCAPVTEKHEALKAALLAGRDPKDAVAALEKALAENEEPFHLHIGM